MQDKNEGLRERTKRYALRIIRLYASLPKSNPGQIVGVQMLRSGTSVGANYREACRSRSNPEFAAKIGIVIQELDETAYWLELLIDVKISGCTEAGLLLKETDELISIFTSIVKKVRNA